MFSVYSSTRASIMLLCAAHSTTQTFRPACTECVVYIRFVWLLLPLTFCFCFFRLSFPFSVPLSCWRDPRVHVCRMCVFAFVLVYECAAFFIISFLMVYLMFLFCEFCFAPTLMSSSSSLVVYTTDGLYRWGFLFLSLPLLLIPFFVDGITCVCATDTYVGLIWNL